MKLTTAGIELGVISFSNDISAPALPTWALFGLTFDFEVSCKNRKQFFSCKSLVVTIHVTSALGSERWSLTSDPTNSFLARDLSAVSNLRLKELEND